MWKCERKEVEGRADLAEDAVTRPSTSLAIATQSKLVILLRASMDRSSRFSAASSHLKRVPFAGRGMVDGARIVYC